MINDTNDFAVFSTHNKIAYNAFKFAFCLYFFDDLSDGIKLWTSSKYG